MRIHSQPAFLLHSRSYRDTSLIVELITPDYGRISAVVKGVRASGKSAKLRRSLLQPFVPLLVGWSGKSELKTLLQWESSAQPQALQGRRLFSALYVNELLTRLLSHSLSFEEGAGELFALYRWVVVQLQQSQAVDIILRQFELQLLACLGYSVEFGVDVLSGQAIAADRRYYYNPNQGFFAAEACERPFVQFNGSDIVAMGQGLFEGPARLAAKRLCRLALAVHLGHKPLKSRELFS